MRYEIVFAPGAVEAFKAMAARHRAEVKDGIESHLRHEPTKTSRSRIKRLRGLSRPQFRLRIGETRVYYDVSESRVEILAVIEKSRSDEWLAKAGERE
jgi:mRNA-degrading endonuclease RelE of RelBE toxin-antitoxin system